MALTFERTSRSSGYLLVLLAGLCALALSLVVGVQAASADELDGADVSDQTAETAASSVTIWRVYNTWTGEHVFTSSQAEYNSLGNKGWRKEGPAWNAPASSNTPVYRVYNHFSGDHHYTTNKPEYDRLCARGWTGENVAFYSAPSTGKPVYRLYNPYVSVGTHHYTTSITEYAKLGYDDYNHPGWREERVGWYGLGSPDSLPSGWMKVTGTLVKTTVAGRMRDLINRGSGLANDERANYYLRDNSPFTCVELGREIQISGYYRGERYTTFTTDFINPSLDFTDYQGGQRLTLAVNQRQNGRGGSFAGSFYGIQCGEVAIL